MKDKILVIFGSMSSEHEISCISASNVIYNLDKEKYEITKMGIDKQGNFFYYTGNVENISKNCWLSDAKNKQEVKNVLEELKKYDVIFPVLHGKYGEDGTIQGLLEFTKVKYVGCNTLGSSIAINKILSKELVASTGIDIVSYISLSNKDYNDINFDKEKLLVDIKEKLELPVIVKPSREGSSYGVKKASTEDEVLKAIDFAFKYDSDILIEKYIDNRKEIECAVLEDMLNNSIYASTPGQIVSANEFYDFEAKYENKESYTNIPADITDDQTEKIKDYSRRIFKALRLNSIARVDFFVSTDKIYFNEVNTMPGFTNISMYPMMLMHDNISYGKILDILIDNAKLN